MPSQKTGNTKWGSGMANVGRTQVCTIVPANHFGPVPGIEVGTCWKFRIQVFYIIYKDFYACINI